MRFRVLTMQQSTTPRTRQRRRSSSRREITPGALTTALSIGTVLVLVALTFVADWFRVPELSLLSSTSVLSPNGDQNFDVATVSYQLSDQAEVVARVVGPNGGVVNTLVNAQTLPAGQHNVVWDGRTTAGQAVTDGQYRLEIIASGTARSTTQSLPVRVDTQPPSIQLVNLPNGQRVRENALTVEGVTDLGATVLVAGSPTPILVDGQGQFSFLHRLEEGTNRLEIVSTDDAGNTASIQREISLITTPPELEIISPTDNAWVNKTVTTISGRTSPNVELSINNEIVQVAADGAFFHQITLEEGDNLIRATATDDVGNVAINEILVRVQTTAPVLSLNLDDGMVFNSPVVQLSGNTQPGAIVLVNGVPVQVGQGGSFQTSLQLVEGMNSINVEVRDLAGNVTSLNRQVAYQLPRTPTFVEDMLRNLAVLPSAVVPALVAIGFIAAFVVLRQRGVSMSISVDQPTFVPGLPGEGKVMMIWLDLNQTTRVTLEVMDVNGYPVATILRDRRRPGRRHTFTWDGYDDFGRPLNPGSYTIQAEAGVSPVTVQTSFGITIGEDILVHRRGQTRGVSGMLGGGVPSVPGVIDVDVNDRPRG